MDLLDQSVIGYEAAKELLHRILDILRHGGSYKKRGIPVPHGLLMISEPGLGKSLMAKTFLQTLPLPMARSGPPCKAPLTA